ncbi:MAG: carbohydrate kinase family protein [Candidatus Hydrogenedentes bacterium]|nr:carbohydrate kinase family protein [Candidatus Hydrogenedentota bacterium]
MELDVVSLGLSCADVMVRPVDAFPERGKLSLVPNLEIHLGGLAGVTATVLSRLGVRTAFVGKLGEDGFGDYILGDLQRHGVCTDKVLRTSEAGTPATVVLISKDGERTFLHHPGCSALLTEDDVDFDFVRQGRHLHWGGPAVTAGLDGEPIGRILKRAKGLGLTTSMDTCYDGQGKWYARIEYALPHLDIVMSSLEEARMYTGAQTPEAIADFYLEHGAKIALIKLGGDGVFVKDSLESFQLPAHQVNVVDTTGAGDAACGGFLYGFLQGWGLQQCARLANAVGGLTVQAMGGAEGVHSLDKTLAFMESGPLATERV